MKRLGYVVNLDADDARIVVRFAGEPLLLEKVRLGQVVYVEEEGERP